MKTSLKECLIAIAALLGSSCYQAARNQCPAIKAKPGADNGIVWGGEANRVTAFIQSVAVECFRNEHPAVEASAVKRGAYSDYKIAATATIRYQIHDEKLLDGGPVTANVIFEAVSPNGVVLGSGMTEIQVVKNGTSCTASGSISGLSDAEVDRIAVVQARWDYGR